MGFTHSLVGKDGFRLRGEEMSRIDGFSDVVFGFALTLIVASLEVPKTYEELRIVMLGFLPFAICFGFLMMVWLTHFRFFRRFGLHDLGTILINAGLLFTVLFYVYPLKFLFTMIETDALNLQTTEKIFHNVGEYRELTLMYAFGFAAIYALLTSLNVHAWRLRRDLHLNALEELILRSEIVDLAAVSGIGLLVALVAYLLPPVYAFRCCFLFMLIGPWKTVTGTYFGRKIRQLRERTVIQPLPETH